MSPHGDADHMGESSNIVNNLKVETVIFNCGNKNNMEKELIELLNEKNIEYYTCINKLNIKDIKLYFLNQKDYKNENDNSNVIYTKIYNKTFLFMGDAGVEVENDIINNYELDNIDYIKIGHHGSITSSGKKFIKTINP